tara:strand:- start:10548 stop:10928 length:381 start_codon:yes stop_codon:yes gene_type:complete
MIQIREPVAFLPRTRVLVDYLKLSLTVEEDELAPAYTVLDELVDASRTEDRRMFVSELERQGTEVQTVEVTSIRDLVAVRYVSNDSVMNEDDVFVDYERMTVPLVYLSLSRYSEVNQHILREIFRL